MGCDSKYGNIDIFLQTWHGGRYYARLRSNYGFYRDWSCCESHIENVPQQARLRVFLFILLLKALEEETIPLALVTLSTCYS